MLNAKDQTYVSYCNIYDTRSGVMSQNFLLPFLLGKEFYCLLHSLVLCSICESSHSHMFFVIEEVLLQIHFWDQSHVTIVWNTRATGDIYVACYLKTETLFQNI